MSVLSRSTAVLLIALLTASVFSFTPLFASAVSAPVVADDSFNGTEGMPLVVPAPGVLANDNDGDGGGFVPLTAVTLVDPPSIPGAFSLGNDGSVSFTPTDAEFSGAATFTYTVTDDELLTSAPATVTLNFAAVNDTPVAQSGTLAAYLNAASSSSLGATDIDTGDTLTYWLSSGPSNGIVSIDQVTGAYTYTGNAAGPDSFTWHAFDGTASSSDATINISVSEAEDTLQLCSNGTNNDGDASIDLDDSDCAPFVPQIGISLMLVSDDGGAGNVADITLLFDGATTSGATTTAAVGAHALVGSHLNAYESTIGGDCAADGTIQLAIGDSAHCTITYNDKPMEGGGNPGQAIQELVGNGPISSAGPFIGSIGSVLGASTTLPELPEGCTPMLSGFFRKSNIQNDADQVIKLQKFLNEHVGSVLPLSGEFGPETDAAVRAFQLKHADQILNPWGLESPTGFVYLTTQRWINLMSCSTLDIPMPKLVPYHQA